MHNVDTTMQERDMVVFNTREIVRIVGPRHEETVPRMPLCDIWIRRVWFIEET